MNLFKQTISIALITILFSGIGVKSIITFHYFINQSEIIKLFCINKDKPELKCNGKCHLAQELKKVEANDDELPFLPSQSNINTELIFKVIETILNLNVLNADKKKYLFIYAETEIKRYLSITYPPPKEIV
ncbi:MAG: hypothetical protein K0B10_02280 [Vicingaceae bacterium]|nr:hypothetical protein [Vicingaceae bacterium]